MSVFPGIQLTSPMIANVAFPLDRKTYCADKTERNTLTVTQRWLWMLVWVVSESKRFRMSNEPWTTSTTDSDWTIFGAWWTQTGTGSPEWVIDPVAGQIYIDTGWTIYFNPAASGTTGWQMIQSQPIE